MYFANGVMSQNIVCVIANDRLRVLYLITIDSISIKAYDE